NSSHDCTFLCLYPLRCPPRSRSFPYTTLFRSLITIAVSMMAACSRNPQASAPPPKAAPEEPLRATVWTGKGELFLEYPALVVNQDRKSTRLNSSHDQNTYAVFCLKKRTQTEAA